MDAACLPCRLARALCACLLAVGSCASHAGEASGHIATHIGFTSARYVLTVTAPTTVTLTLTRMNARHPITAVSPLDANQRLFAALVTTTTGSAGQIYSGTLPTGTYTLQVATTLDDSSANGTVLLPCHSGPTIGLRFASSLPLGIVADSDGDGLVDTADTRIYGGGDVNCGFPYDDADGDGLDDATETAAGLDPMQPGDAWADPDGDGVVTLVEVADGSDPLIATSTPANRAVMAVAWFEQRDFALFTASRPTACPDLAALATPGSLEAPPANTPRFRLTGTAIDDLRQDGNCVTRVPNDSGASGSSIRISSELPLNEVTTSGSDFPGFAGVDLGLHLDARPALLLGAPQSLAFTVTNNGSTLTVPRTMTRGSLVVRVTAPADAVLTEPPGTGNCTVAGDSRSLECSFTTLANGASVALPVQVMASTPGALGYVAYVRGLSTIYAGNNDAQDLCVFAQGSTAVAASAACAIGATRVAGGGDPNTSDNLLPQPMSAAIVFSADTDADGIADAEDDDDDNDTMPDAAEVAAGLNPLDAADATADADRDGASNRYEIAAGSNASNPASVPTGALDIDGDGTAQALSDGILVLRHLFGFTGEALARDVVSATATRRTPEALAARFVDMERMLDVDVSATRTPLTDGLMVLRRLFAFDGTALIDGVLSPQATRTHATDIGAAIDRLRP